MTSENMKRFGFVKKPVTLKEFDAWLHYIPPFFIAVAFILCAVQAVIEARIEASELERRMRREKASATLRKYFKKKQDKFDKVDYLGDMYKLIKQTLDEIKKQIAENNRRTEEEGKDNMNTRMDPETCQCGEEEVAQCSVSPLYSLTNTSTTARVATYIGLLAIAMVTLTILITLYLMATKKRPYRDLR